MRKSVIIIKEISEETRTIKSKQNKQNADNKKPFFYGGQAVLEGVMMQGPEGKTISCRRPDGSIIYKTDQKKPLKDRYPILKWPIVRGCYSFVMSLISGMSDISWSAMQSGEEGEPMTTRDLVIAILLAVVLVVALFIALPVFVGTLALDVVGPFGRSLIEGLLRIVLFIGYVLIISRMPEIQRLFAYHGAEHKTINAYEAGEELLPEKIKNYSRIHTRCGTSFLLMSMLLMIIVFTFFGQTTAFYRILIKLAMMPLIAGLAYELFRLPLKFPHNPLVRALVAPGLALQRLTTKEPDTEMMEVAINSLTLAPGFVPSYTGVPTRELELKPIKEGEKLPESITENITEEVSIKEMPLKENQPIQENPKE